MASVSVTRAGAILAVADVERSSAWYSRHLGFSVDASYDDPPYAILSLHGTRLSLAEQGHPAEDRPGVTMVAPEDPSRLQVALVLEVEDCRGAHAALETEGVDFLADPYEPPWGGARVFAIDPDGYLVELEELA
jgi:catechol 2,3-dioxygenase-like lactoylglutathione lyase family enzyme